MALACLMCVIFAVEPAQASWVTVPLPYDRNSSFLVADYIARGWVERVKHFGPNGDWWMAVVRIRKLIRGRLQVNKITVTYKFRGIGSREIKQGMEYFFLLRNNGRSGSKFIAGPADVYSCSGYSKWVFKTHLRKLNKYRWQLDAKTGLGLLLFPLKKKAPVHERLALVLYLKNLSGKSIRLPMGYRSPKTSIWAQVHMLRNGKRLRPLVQRKKLSLYQQRRSYKAAVRIGPGKLHVEAIDFMARCIAFPLGNPVTGFRCFGVLRSGKYEVYVRLRNFPKPGLSVVSNRIKVEISP